MTLSKDARSTNLDDAVLILMDNLHGQSAMEVFIDERYLDSRILGTTWSQLKEQSLVRQANNSRWLYTLSGYGLLHGLKMRGEFDTEETRSEEHTSELQSLRHLVCRLL